MKRLFLFLAILISLSACAPDPRDTADAERTAALTAQDILDRTVSRDQAAKLQELQLQERQATQADRIQALRMIILTGGVAASVFMLAMATIGIYAAGSGARAFHRRMDLQARLIHLDPVTLSWPLIPRYEGKGIYKFANPNTGEVMALDSRQPADQRLIHAFLTGQIARIQAEIESRAGKAEIVSLGRKYDR